MDLVKTEKSTDFFNSTLGYSNHKSGFGASYYYCPNGRQLRRAVERANRKGKKKNKAFVEGCFLHTLDKQ